MRSDGGDWVAGMVVRSVDIDVTGVNREVDAATLSTINGIDHHYGHAGLLFCAALHRKWFAPTARRAPRAEPKNGEGDRRRQCRQGHNPCGTATSADLSRGQTGKKLWPDPVETAVEHAVWWAWDRFSQSSDAVAALDPEAQVIARLITWIAQRWDVTVKSTTPEDSRNNREPLACYDDTAIYIPKETLREAAGGNLRESQVAPILHRRGLIARRTEGDCLYVRFVPKVGKVQAYALSRAQFARSKDAVDPESPLSVVQGARSG